MKKSLIILLTFLVFVSCKDNQSKSIASQASAASLQKWNAYPSGQPFYQYGKTNTINFACNGLIDTAALVWTNDYKCMYISSIISGGNQLCMNINGNIIGPISTTNPPLSNAVGQVIPVNLFIPQDTLITIINSGNSLIVSGIKY